MKIFCQLCRRAVTVLLAILASGCTSMQPLPAGTLTDLAPPTADCPSGQICLTTHRKPLLPVDARLYLHPLTLTPAVQAHLAEDHEEEAFRANTNTVVRRELERRYQLVSEPAEADAQLKIAITDVTRASPALNLVSTAFLFLPIDLGGCQLEALLTDREGRPIATDFAQASGSVLDFRAAFSPYGHALLGVERWVSRFSDSLARTEWSYQP